MLLPIKLGPLKVGLIGITLLLLTGPYSPDLNLIEDGWGKLSVLICLCRY